MKEKARRRREMTNKNREIKYCHLLCDLCTLPVNAETDVEPILVSRPRHFMDEKDFVCDIFLSGCHHYFHLQQHFFLHRCQYFIRDVLLETNNTLLFCVRLFIGNVVF